jgi:stringent starvation protein B
MSRKNRLPPKKDVALALLENSTLFLHLDPRHGEVKVPPWFKRQPQLVLQVGLNMPVPIPDLNVDDDGVSCTLSFNRAPHFCFVPWAAIYALVGEDGRGMVWPDDVPPEVAAQVQPQAAAQPKPRAKLRAVSSEGSPTEPAPPELAAPTKLAEPEAGTDAARAPKKPRKRAQKPRAAATPKREAARPARPVLAPVQEPAPARDAAEPRQEAPDGSKKKRELPPYLRVVK